MIRSVRSVAWLTLLVLVMLFSGCVQPVTDPQSGRLQVTVSIVPQKYFVERIGGDLVSVNVMVGPGETPHSYEPSAEQLRAVSQSALYFRIGVEFEDAWMQRIADASPHMVIVDTTTGIDYLPLASDGHSDDPEGPGSGAHLDPHIWLSPKRVKALARTMATALIASDPDHRHEYETNLASFLNDIDILETEITSTLQNLETRRFIVLHPAWGYFAQDFGLEEIPVEVGGQEPSAAELGDLVALAQRENIRVVFAQPTMTTRTAETIAEEIGGRVLLIDPLAEDWLANMRQVAETFAETLGSKPVA